MNEEGAAMGESNLAMHYVCTHDKALDLINEHTRFWVSNCGCRERRGQCTRSRMDVCLMFNPDDSGSGSGKKEITLADAMEILREAESKHLVARPFRNKDRTDTDGICFCCDDCCGYFLDPKETCDKGKLIEKTDLKQCTQCGACESVCYFCARKMKKDKLMVNRDKCYGCGLCVDACPVNCIEMVKRKS